MGKSGPAHVVTPGGTLPELQFKFREGWIEIVNGTPGVISLCGTYGPNMLRMDLSDISEAWRIEMTQDPFYMFVIEIRYIWLHVYIADVKYRRINEHNRVLR